MRIILMGAAMGALMGSALAEQADLQEVVKRCWNPPSGVEDVSVTVSFAINERGELIGMPASPDAKSADLRKRSAAEAAIRAVRLCAPYLAPEGHHRVDLPEPMPNRA